jgi:hypothetical protein
VAGERPAFDDLRAAPAGDGLHAARERAAGGDARGRRDPAPERFRLRFMEIENWIKKTFRKTHPKGFFVGPRTAKVVKQTGLKLRENKHWGKELAIQSA